MVGSDPLDSMGVVGGDGGVDGSADGNRNAGWELVAGRDGAAALIDAILDLDPEAEYTKTELSDVADLAYKTLYLDGTVEALVDLGLLERRDREGEETTFRVVPDSPVFEAAAAFDAAAMADE